MTAATERTDITQWGAHPIPGAGSGKLLTNTAVKKGWHVAKNAAGYTVPYTATTGLISEGLAEADADSTGLASGSVEIPTIVGVVDQAIGGGGDVLVDADAPCAVYALDNQTVGKTSNGGARSLAGVFLGINPETGKARVGVGRSWWAIAKAMADAAAADAGGAIHTGSTTLVAGLKTVNDANVTATSKILVSRTDANGSTAIGLLEGGKTIVAGVSFTIASLKEADGTTQTNDVSKVAYVIIG